MPLALPCLRRGCAIALSSAALLTLRAGGTCAAEEAAAACDVQGDVEEAEFSLLQRDLSVQDRRMHTQASEVQGQRRQAKAEETCSPFSYARWEMVAPLSGESHGKEAVSQPIVEQVHECSIEPHVVRATAAPTGGPPREWHTSSPALVAAWLEGVLSPEEELASLQHAGASAVRWARPGRPEVFLSVLRVQARNRTGGPGWCGAALFTFETVPPFRLRGFGRMLLPLRYSSDSVFCSQAGHLEVRVDHEDKGLQLLHHSPLIGGLTDAAAWMTAVDSAHLVMKVSALANFLPPDPPGAPGVTLVMMSHSRKRWEGLQDILRKYRAMPLLEEIVLIWNDPEDATASDELRALNAERPGVPLRVLDARINSMNNRFAVWETVSTEGVIIQDDDLWVEQENLTVLVEVWRQHPEQLVGAYMERDHFERDNATGHLAELRPVYSKHKEDEEAQAIGTYWGPEFSQVLPHPWVVATQHLHLYMQGAPMARLVDESHNCDDIYMNAVVANFTRAPPIAVDVFVHFFPTANDDSSMWNTDPEWAQHRTECLEQVDAFYAGQPKSAQTGTVWRVAPGPYVPALTP